MEWIFLLGWLLPLVFVAFAVARFARRVRQIQQRCADPEALVAALREGLASTPGEVGPHRAPTPGSPELHAPYEEESHSPLWRWLAVVMALLVAGFAMQLR